MPCSIQSKNETVTILLTRFIFILKTWGCRNKAFKWPKAFIEHANAMDDVYNNIDDDNTKRKRNILMVFENIIADIMTNKNFLAKMKELFTRWWKLNISHVFIMQSYFSVPKEVR